MRRHILHSFFSGALFTLNGQFPFTGPGSPNARGVKGQILSVTLAVTFMALTFVTAPPAAAETDIKVGTNTTISTTISTTKSTTQSSLGLSTKKTNGSPEHKASGHFAIFPGLQVEYSVSLGKSKSKPFAVYSFKDTAISDFLNLEIKTTTGSDHDDFLITMTRGGDVQKEMYCRTEVESGNVHTSKVSVTTVTLRNDKYLGVQKVISCGLLQLAGGPPNVETNTGEWLVDSDEIITTLLQLPVFVGCLTTVPIEGINLRCIVDGKPIPVRLLPATATRGSYVVQLFRVNNQQGKQKDELLASFEYNSRPKAFRMPDRINIMPRNNHLNLTKTRDTRL